MAVGLAMEGKNANYNGRTTPFVILSCAIAAMGGLLFGYEIGISGLPLIYTSGVTSMEPFLKKFFPEVYRKMKEDSTISNYCKFDSQLLTAFTSLLYITGLVTSFFASSVTRAFGRRLSIFAGSAAFLAGGVVGGAAVNVYMLILGRVLLGIGIGFANQSVPLYLSEMAPARYRGAINNGFSLSIAIGVLFANVLNFSTEKIKAGWGWRVSLAMAVVPASILTLGTIFLPDTPNSLIQRNNNNREKAKLTLQRIRGTTDVEEELQDLITASTISKTVDHPFQKIFQRKYRPQLVMSIAIPFFQQMTGINVVSFYEPVLFRTIGLDESASLLTAVVTGLVSAFSTIIAMIVVDRVGRRAVFMIGGVQMFITQMLVGGILAAKLGDHGGLDKGYAYLVLVLISIYAAGFGWSWGPVGWLIPSEIFQLEIRSAGQSITVAVSFLFIFAVAQAFSSMLCHLKSGIFFFFGGWVAVMTGFVYLLLPETKNMPIEKMEKVWKEHWFWKRFVADRKEESNVDGSAATRSSF